MAFTRSGAYWNVAFSGSGFVFALAQFGVFSWAKNFRDHWDRPVFVDLERAGRGFDDAVLWTAGGVSGRNDSAPHVFQNVA